MEPFKDRIDGEAVGRLAGALAAGTPGFPAEAFAAAAAAGLAPLELKDRVRHVARVLRAHLPADFEAALEVLLRGLGPPLAGEDGVAEGFELWPVLHVVEAYGLATPEASLAALREMTRRFSAEFAIRPFLREHPELAWAAVETWATDPDVHVRRLCSEGTRPRLPWGGHLAGAIADPSRGLALIARLVDDEALYVRRSVANHLNDVAKDHPERAVATAARWLAEPTPERSWAARHGLRTLFRAGDEATLRLFGFGPPQVTVDGPHLPPEVRFPGTAELVVGLTSTAAAPTAVRVEWVVHGPRWRKVFRGPERALVPGETWAIRKRFPMKPVTTRRHAPGTYTIAVQVNGEVLGQGSFTLLGGDADGG